MSNYVFKNWNPWVQSWYCKEKFKNTEKYKNWEMQNRYSDYNVPKLNQQVKYLNRPIMSNKIEAVIKNLPI